MRELATVTLACVDTLNPALARRAIDECRRRVAFARCLIFTDRADSRRTANGDVEVVPIAPIASRDAYSRFVLKQLVDHVQTDHLLLVQWDGYVVNADAWDDAFLDVDYLGARWFWHDDGHDIGNGGFSLRSRRLLKALQDPRIEPDAAEAEDVSIGRTFRTLLEREHGIRFGDAALADRFAFEAAYPIARPFGFHGLYNFCRVMPPAELVELSSRFTEAILRSPQLRQLLRNCVALGQWSPAIVIARRILAVDPADEEAQRLLAQGESSLRVHAGIGRNNPCPCGSGKRFKVCHGAIGISVVTPDQLVDRGMRAHRAGDLSSAARDYEEALARAPDHAHALHYAGMIAWQQGRIDEALPRIERAAALRPDEPEFTSNLGVVLASVDRNAEAAAAHRRALALRPDHAGAWNNLGLVLREMNDVDGAIAAYRHALAIQPDFIQARFNLSLALLHAGRFDEGWVLYEARMSIPAFALRDPPATPRWTPGTGRSRTVLLKAEQGLGDAIQFVRFAEAVASEGSRVIVHAPRPLNALLSTVPGVADVVADDTPFPAHDAWLPMLSLPGALRVAASSIPARVPYIGSDKRQRSEVALALQSHANALKAGIAWAGNRRNTNDRRRSIPSSLLAPLFAIEGTCWMSLQQSGEHDHCGEALIRTTWRDSLDGIAALIDNVDVVVTVDTSIAHLAGALAKPVLVLLPYSSDWRWGIDRSDSDWYPTATLFRQPAPGDWPSTIAATGEAIRKMVRMER
ncbi:MAG TPA: DUF5672 family protein [Casimicrobiaceae bacterium]|nr:DUF5672 family protein [Casimicrobiaceae bacterium]